MAIKVVVLVPEKDNDGLPFTRHLWRELDARLAVFGGLSKVGGIEGMWLYDGRIYRDRNYQYVSYLSSWMDLPRWLDLVRWISHAFRQKAVAIEVAGTPEVVAFEDESR